MPLYRVSLRLTSPSGEVATDTLYCTAPSAAQARDLAFALCQQRIEAGTSGYVGADIAIGEPEEKTDVLP